MTRHDQEDREASAEGFFVGKLQPAVQLVQRVAASTASILITGESGTGKEVIARLIHEQSPRAAKPQVCINCAALPESLIESELFGHRRGAFTGAEMDREGCFEAAKGGTLLLDEISEIPLSVQAKLLRVLEARVVQRVGSNLPVSLDVRIVATSNRNLPHEVAAGKFRLDLFHRLNVIHIELPPLRERREDIAPLAHHFLTTFRTENALVSLSGFNPAAIQRLEQYDWPGNVRELRNVVHRSCLLASSPEIAAADLGEFGNQERQDASLNQGFGERTLAEIEQMAIRQALDRHGWNRASAASQLGISTRTIFNKLQQYEGAGPGLLEDADSLPMDRRQTIAFPSQRAA